MEGITAEAASLAGHLRLGKLIFLYDQNHITLAGATDLTFTEDVAQRFQAYGWHTRIVQDGNDTDDIAHAIEEAQAEPAPPVAAFWCGRISDTAARKSRILSIRTASPLGEDEVARDQEGAGLADDGQVLSAGRRAWRIFREAVAARGQARRRVAARASMPTKLRSRTKRREFESDSSRASCLTAGLPICRNGSRPISRIATRVAGGAGIECAGEAHPEYHRRFGGSESFDQYGDEGPGRFSTAGICAGRARAGAVGGAWGYAGRNVAFGVREHAMGAAVNGMAAHGGVLPFSATFFVFSDYMKPAVRLGAIMRLKAFYVFTHDSIGVGEDGPTHEPIEQLAGVRAIPGLTVIRPADANESAEAWAFAVQHNGADAAGVHAAELPILDRAGARMSGKRGAYILADAESGTPDVLLIGTVRRCRSA